jgi:hypothetical protein
MEALSTRATSTRRRTEAHGGKKGFESKHSTDNPILEVLHIEVQEQANSATEQPHVGEQLRFVYWKNFLQRLQLDNHHAFNHQIKAKTAVQLLAFVDYGNWQLPLD